MPKQPSGTPASYLIATSLGQAVTGAQDLAWTETAAQNIALVSNTTVTLTPGHRYICEADLSALNFDNASGIVAIAWADDSDDSALPLSDGGASLISADTIAGDNDASKPNTTAVVDLRTATANLVVKVRVFTLTTATTVSVGGTIRIFQS